jgi:hypothetical protein
LHTSADAAWGAGEWFFRRDVTSAFINDTPVGGDVPSHHHRHRRLARRLDLEGADAVVVRRAAGGTTTLIGTSTNLLAAGVAAKSGISIAFFEFTVPATIMAAAGFLYRASCCRGSSSPRAGMAVR